MQPQIITIDFSKRKRVKNKWIDMQYMIEYNHERIILKEVFNKV